MKDVYYLVVYEVRGIPVWFGAWKGAAGLYLNCLSVQDFKATLEYHFQHSLQHADLDRAPLVARVDSD